MSQPNQNIPLSVSKTTIALGNLELMKKVDQACLKFEENWNAEQKSSLTEFLIGWDEPDRAILLTELLLTDFELRQNQKNQLSKDDYLKQLPDDCETIEQVFQQISGDDQATLQQLVARLRSSGVLNSKQVEQILQIAGISGDDNGDSDSVFRLKETLISQGDLTAFQVAILSEPDPKIPLVLGDYIVLDHVGKGGMGLVLKAMHRRMKRIVALKILPAEVASSSDRVQRFEREVEAAARLIHPNIVTAYDAGQDKDTHYLIMELVNGQDLSQHVKTHGPVPAVEAVQMTIQTAQGLKYAHEYQVIHRDIKPANLLLTAEGTVKILDMGLARLRTTETDKGLAETELTGTGVVMGTIDYAAPEQARDAKKADARSDIYSLGCTLYFLLTGERVFNEESAVDRLIAHRQQAVPELSTALPGISEQLNACFQKMVAKEPVDRFQSMEEVIVALETCDVKEQLPIVELLPQVKPRKTLLTVALSVVAILIAVGFSDLWLGFGIIFKVDTPGGTIVLEVEQAELDDAQIKINDDQTVTIKIAGDPQEVHVAAKSGFLQVSKAGFKTETFKFEIVEKTGKALVKVHLKKLPAVTVEDPDAWMTQQEQYRRAAEWIISVGGYVNLINDGPHAPIKKLEYLPSKPFYFSGVNLQDIKEPIDDGLKHLAGLKKLQELNAYKSSLTDTGLLNLTNNKRISFPELSKVTVSGTSVSDVGWNCLSSSPVLKDVLINNTKITDGRWIAQCSHLESLQIEDTMIPPEHLSGIDKLNSLTDLKLSGSHLQGVGSQHVSGCRMLNALLVSSCKDGFEETCFKNMINLQSLYLGGMDETQFSIPFWSSLVPLHHLESIQLSSDSGISLSHALPLKSVKQVKLYCHNSTALSGIEVVNDLFPNVDKLYLNSCGLMDSDLKHLEPCSRLKILSIHSNKNLTEKAVLALDYALPNCQILSGFETSSEMPTLVEELEEIESLPGADRRAADWLLSVGGSVHIEIDGKTLRIGADFSLPDEDFYVVRINLSKRVPEEEFANLAGLGHLKSAYLQYCPLPDSALKHLAHSRQLQALSLLGTPISDETLESLKHFPHLRGLQLASNFTDDALEHISQLSELKGLTIGFKSISDRGLSKLASLDQLERLTLKNLNFESEELSEAGLKPLQSLKLLKNLDFAGCDLDAASIRELAMWTQVENFSLWGKSRLSADAIKELTKFTHLKSLVLWEADISDADIRYLAKLTNLNTLAIGDNNLSAASIAALQQALPNCKVIAND